MTSSTNQPTISSNGVLRPTFVEVNLTRLTENYNAIKKAVAPAAVMPILKANAYGHGLVEVAQHLVTLDVPYLGVAFLEEGILLREVGIGVPILVLGGIIGNQIPLFLQHNLTLTASSVEKLLQIDAAAKRMGVVAKVHLKIDTGMERIGVHYYNADSLLEVALTCKHCLVEGIYSHFANADTAGARVQLSSVDNAGANVHAQIQLNRFNQLLQFYKARHLPRPPLQHVANSGAILQLPNSHFNMVRAGILLYGVYPSEEVAQTIVVRPCLSWKSRVVYFKVVQPGHPVSYGSTWQSDQQTRIVTIPVGYGDGYFRAMSNKAKVVIRGKRYSTVGHICMDQLMVNIGWESAYNNDEVILIGEMGDMSIKVEEVATWANTIPYEILTNINTRVPRIYIKKA